jgi:polyisoprenoid-binding protein YceI
MNRAFFGPLILAIATLFANPTHAATFELDPAHTNVGFGVRHIGINTVRGNFQAFTGTIQFDAKKPEASKINVQIDTASINTGNPKRDGHVKSPDFLDVAKFPKMTFVSKSVKPDGAGGFVVTGDLTLHGVTKPVTLKVTEFTGPGKSPLDKKDHIGASVTGTIIRQDFGIVWNGGGVTGIAGEAAVGNEIKLQLDVDAAAKGEKTASN